MSPSWAPWFSLIFLYLLVAVKNSLTCSAPEGEQELGKPLKEDRDLQSIPDSGDWQESPENSISDASWTVVQKVRELLLPLPVSPVVTCTHLPPCPLFYPKAFP